MKKKKRWENILTKFFHGSYELVSDEKEHTVELLSERQNFTLRVDSGLARSMVNAGEMEYLEVGTPVFLGGVPPDVGKHAQMHWHLRNSSSFRGEILLVRATILYGFLFEEIINSICNIFLL